MLLEGAMTFRVRGVNRDVHPCSQFTRPTCDRGFQRRGSIMVIILEPQHQIPQPPTGPTDEPKCQVVVIVTDPCDVETLSDPRRYSSF